ncbi:MAG: reductase anchor subunit, partial [Firmicutes bacterium]|nr:reductase anchor subunit [Bacillota bacterium]
MSEEWPLLTFTILGQLAIGTFIMLVIVRSLLGAKIGAKAAGEVTRFGILAVGPVMLVALIASFFHLGSPMLAFNALGNLKTSWLSREILFTGLFFLLWLITYYSSKKEGSGQVLSWCTSIVGLIAVFCMAGIYAHSNKPAWTNVNTYLTFFGAAFVMGAIASGAAVAYGAKGKSHEEPIRRILSNVSLI